MNQAKFRLTILLAILGLGFLSSCRQPTFINLTSKNISQNPSGIYTLQTEGTYKTAKLILIQSPSQLLLVERPLK